MAVFGGRETIPHMNPQAFPYKWTCVVGLIFLASVLWSDVRLDPFSFLFLAASTFCLFVSVIASIVLAVFQKSKSSLYRILINAAFCLLFFPTTRVGSVLRDRLFLAHLARFQEVTNLLIKNQPAHVTTEASVSVVRLPAGYSALHVADQVLIDSTREGITVRYISRDSSALGHRGFMYRSDDDAIGLGKEFPRLGCTRVAPHWFFFSD